MRTGQRAFGAFDGLGRNTCPSCGSKRLSKKLSVFASSSGSSDGCGDGACREAPCGRERARAVVQIRRPTLALGLPERNRGSGRFRLTRMKLPSGRADRRTLRQPRNRGILHNPLEHRRWFLAGIAPCPPPASGFDRLAQAISSGVSPTTKTSSRSALFLPGPHRADGNGGQAVPIFFVIPKSAV